MTFPLHIDHCSDDEENCDHNDHNFDANRLNCDDCHYNNEYNDDCHYNNDDNDDYDDNPCVIGSVKPVKQPFFYNNKMRTIIVMMTKTIAITITMTMTI